MGVIIDENFNWFKELYQRYPKLINNPELKEKRKLKIALFNLMPNVLATEEQWAESLLFNDETQVELVFFYSLIRPSTKVAKNHHKMFYKNWKIYDFSQLDAIILTGAPVELLEYSQIDYFDEIKELLDKSIAYDLNLLLICWGAFSALKHFYNVPKVTFEQKILGNFEHKVVPRAKTYKLMDKLGDTFQGCISRYSTLDKESVLKNCNPLFVTDVDGVDCTIDKRNSKIIYLLNHFEYVRDTLLLEYQRDLAKGVATTPINYFPDNDIDKKPLYSWYKSKKIIFTNWLTIVKDNIRM